jgi:hypothetical protein
VCLMVGFDDGKFQGSRQGDKTTAGAPGYLCRGLQQRCVFLGSGAQAAWACS